MKRALRLIIVATLGLGVALAQARAQQPQPASAQPTEPASAPAFKPAELDQLLAPIALYPDDLIVQILTASTYPLEIVMAARWVADPKNAALKGDALVQALEKESWDPSVKSLVPFPAVLKKMSEKLDWTQKLGDAFIGQEKDCLAAVQRLRRKAQAAGTLKSTPQQKVTVQQPQPQPAPTSGGAPAVMAPLSEEPTIEIAPTDPAVVYVPSYDPATAYGAWPYPDYPPYSFPPPAGYPVGSALLGGLAFGAGIAITSSLWGWGSANWGAGNINVNTNRYNQINANRGAISSNTWQHNAAHRQGVAYRDAATNQRFGRSASGADARRDYRGYAGQGAGAAGGRGGGQTANLGNRPGRDQGAANRPGGGGAGGGQRPNVGQGGGQRPNIGQGGGGQRPNIGQGGGGQRPNIGQGGGQRPNIGQGGGQRPNIGQRTPTQRSAFNPGNGAQTRAFAERGAASRQQMGEERKVAAVFREPAAVAVVVAAAGVAAAGVAAAAVAAVAGGVEMSPRPGRTPASAARSVRAPPRLAAALGLVLLLCVGGMPAASAADTAPPRQESFASPEDALKAVVADLKSGDVAGLVRIFGPGIKPVLNSGDPVEDKNARERFVAAAEEGHHFDGSGDTLSLVVGKDDWPFPIPLKKEGERWRFDTKAGKEELLDRRIGQNELATIQTMLAYVDAQRDFAELQRSQTGIAEYAQHVLSAPGKRDGLYWPTAEGEPPSPLGPLVAEARAAGYRRDPKAAAPIPYHGYYFKILTGQGPDAPGGAADYIVNGHMIGGFGAVAWPARYGDSGVMTFIVNHDGIVYQKDLGPETATLAAAITRFDPGPGWRKTEP